MSRAGLLLALALGAGAIWPEAPPTPLCHRPQEVASVGGHSTVATCEMAGAEAALRGPARLLFGLRLDANRADAASFEALPGIGPRRAASLVGGREQAGLCGVGDLLRVRGIGPVIASRIAPHLDFSCPD